MTYAVTLAAVLLLLVAIHATEAEPVMTRSKRKRLRRERLRFNPRLK